MKLVFYGGGDDQDNKKLDKEFFKIINTSNPLFTFIPASSYDSDLEFVEFVKQYKRFGITDFLHFPVDREFDSTLYETLFHSKVIHLHGGNTYYFLNTLKRSGIYNFLQEFVSQGGILTGLSAGAIIMSPCINTAGFPSFDKDENEDKIRNLKGLDLVRFEFFPHYRNSQRYDREILSYSKKTNNPIYACPDGNGIIVESDTIKFVDKCYMFKKGKKYLISP